jgi:cell division protein FtsB
MAKKKTKQNDVRRKGSKKSSQAAKGAPKSSAKAARPAPKSAKPKPKGRRLIFLGVIAVILAVVLYSGFTVYNLKAEEKAAKEQLEEKKSEKERVERELSVVTNPEYVENQARELLRMIKAGEMLYVFESEEEDSQ